MFLVPPLVAPSVLEEVGGAVLVEAGVMEAPDIALGSPGDTEPEPGSIGESVAEVAGGVDGETVEGAGIELEVAAAAGKSRCVLSEQKFR